MEKGPGLSEMPKIFTLGSNFAQALPMGNDSNIGTIYIKKGSVCE